MSLLEGQPEVPYPSLFRLPDAEDDQALAMLGDGADYRYDPKDQIGLSRGRQSDVSVIQQYEDGIAVRSLVFKRKGVGKGLTLGEANELWDLESKYEEDLHKASWDMPTVLAASLARYGKEKRNEEWRIICLESHIKGGDGEVLLRDESVPDERKWQMVGSVVGLLFKPGTQEGARRREIGGQEFTGLRIAYDYKFANLAFRNTVTFDPPCAIDRFGPKPLDKEGHLIGLSPKLDPLPHDSLLVVTATVEGMALRLQRLCESYWHGSDSTLAERRERFISVITEAGASPVERDFIAREIKQGYPLLRQIYSEAQV